MDVHIPPGEVHQDDQLMAAASDQLGKALTRWREIQDTQCCAIHANRAAHRYVHDIIQQGDNSVCLMLVTAVQRLAAEDARAN